SLIAASSDSSCELLNPGPLPVSALSRQESSELGAPCAGGRGLAGGFDSSACDSAGAIISASARTAQAIFDMQPPFPGSFHLCPWVVEIVAGSWGPQLRQGPAARGPLRCLPLCLEWTPQPKLPGLSLYARS